MERIYAAAVAIGATMGITLAATALASGPVDHELNFRVMLDNKPIGHHSFSISEAGNSTVVNITAEFDVRIFFLNAYSYLHQNTEIWQDGCLRRIDSSTNANGARFAVNGEKEEGTFELATLDQSYSLNNECVMTFAYWDRSFLSQSRLLNAQTGDYVEVKTEALGRRRLELADGSVWAEGFRVFADKDGLDIKVWYEENSNQWIGLESQVSSRKVLRYEPTTVNNLLTSRPSAGITPASG